MQQISWQNLITILYDDGIIECKLIKDTTFNYEYALQNLKLRTDLESQYKQRIFSYLETTTLSTKKGRDLNAGDHAHAITAALALITDSTITKVTFNFFIMISKPSYPVKIFNNVESAKIWLQSFPKEEINKKDLQDFYEFYKQEITSIENKELILL